MKKDVWKGYDFEAMPPLTGAQLKTFRRVTPERHQEYAAAVQRHIGRPRKNPLEKENPVSIRFSPLLLKRLKAKAHRKGFRGWQTYAKKVLEADLARG